MFFNVSRYNCVITLNDTRTTKTKLLSFKKIDMRNYFINSVMKY